MHRGSLSVSRHLELFGRRHSIIAMVVYSASNMIDLDVFNFINANNHGKTTPKAKTTWNKGTRYTICRLNALRRLRKPAISPVRKRSCVAHPATPLPAVSVVFALPRGVVGRALDTRAPFRVKLSGRASNRSSRLCRTGSSRLGPRPFEKRRPGPLQKPVPDARPIAYQS